MNPDIAVWKQMSGSGIHVACVGLVFWLLVHREDEAQDHEEDTKNANEAKGVTGRQPTTRTFLPVTCYHMTLRLNCRFNQRG